MREVIKDEHGYWYKNAEGFVRMIYDTEHELFRVETNRGDNYNFVYLKHAKKYFDMIADRIDRWRYHVQTVYGAPSYPVL